MKGITSCGECCYYDWENERCSINASIKDNYGTIYLDCPLLDVVPVQYGKWERTDITEESGWALYRCSCCNWHTTYYYSFSASPTYNFCPNCGAKMEGD